MKHGVYNLFLLCLSVGTRSDNGKIMVIRLDVCVGIFRDVLVVESQQN